MELDPRALLNAINRRGNGGVPVMRYLIDQGIDINAYLEPYSPPLHCAVSVADLDWVRLLLDKGVDKSIRHLLGQTPVDLAKSRMIKWKDTMKAYEMLSE